jgi:hypothetical protein
MSSQESPTVPDSPGRAFTPSEAAAFLRSIGILGHSAENLKKMRARRPDDPLDAGPAWYRQDNGKYITYFERDLRAYAQLRLGRMLLRGIATSRPGDTQLKRDDAA